MSLSAVYNDDLSRVTLTGTTWGATVTYVIVDRTGPDPGVVRGGAHVATVSGDTLRLSDYEFTPGVPNGYRVRAYNASDVEVPTYSYTTTITPGMDAVWLKSIVRPFLNRKVTATDFSEVTLPARGGTFQVIGRRAEVAVTEVRGSRRYTLVLRAATREEAAAIELALSFGDVMLVHVPEGCVLPRSMVAFVGDVTIERAPGKHNTEVRYITLPLTEVDSPAPELVGSTITWAGVMAIWDTWADLLADPGIPTWLDLQDYVSDPEDEVVG